MINTTSLEQAKRILKMEKGKIIKAQNDVFNLSILEYGKFDVLLSIESSERKDSLRGIDSGMNEILARIAAKNKVAIGLDLEELRNLSKMQKASRLSKIRQNIRLCRKTGTRLAILGIKDKRDAKDLLISLGASTVQVSRALSL